MHEVLLFCTLRFGPVLDGSIGTLSQYQATPAHMQSRHAQDRFKEVPACFAIECAEGQVIWSMLFVLNNAHSPSKYDTKHTARA